MFRPILLIPALALLIGCATTTTALAPIDAAAVVGRWRCGPTTLHGNGFDVSVSTDSTYRADRRFETLTRSVITRAGRTPVTTQDRAEGTWSLSGDVLRTTVRRAVFLSSSDPSISVREGQALQDAQLRRRAVYETRVQRRDATHWRTTPVGDTGASASCTRG